jgi:hypothetical protein
MAQKVRLGIIGMSQGNGHPYSWSAIFNGYDLNTMENCPFPGIPAYLKEQKFPEDSLGELGVVTHIWTQDKKLSEHIAKAAKIDGVVDHMEDMIGKVDAILLARDDAENHVEMAKPFLEAGLPVFIDKPFALNVADAHIMFSSKNYKSQIFTCSSIKYAQELELTAQEKEQLGTILFVEAGISKLWDTYVIHILDPMITQLPHRGKLLNVENIRNGDIHQALIKWENVNAYIKVTGAISTLPEITYFGDKGSVTKTFNDAFSCFKNSLYHFIKQIQDKKLLIPEEETLELVKIIEWGRK